MGVSTNFLVYYGIRLKWNDAFSEAYDDAYDKNEGIRIDVVFDGMGGEYIILGHKLYDSGDYRYGFERGTGDTNYHVSLLKVVEDDYKVKFTQQFPDFAHLVADDFQVISFVHFH